MSVDDLVLHRPATISISGWSCGSIAMFSDWWRLKHKERDNRTINDRGNADGSLHDQEAECPMTGGLSSINGPTML